MQKSLTAFLRDAAALLRDLALHAPEIANELRSFADDLDEEAGRSARKAPKGGSRENHAAERGCGMRD
jgi:hypothetical protein